MPPKQGGKKVKNVEYQEDGITPKLSKAELKEQFMVEFFTQVKINYDLLFRKICPQWRAERKTKVWLELLKFANEDIKVEGMFSLSFICRKDELTDLIQLLAHCLYRFLDGKKTSCF